MPNLIEFAFELDPNQADLSGMPRPTLSGDNFTVSFAQPSGVDGITYGAEVSSNLVNWIPVTDSGSGTTHTFAYPVASDLKFFMRLKVTVP